MLHRTGKSSLGVKVKVTVSALISWVAKCGIQDVWWVIAPTQSLPEMPVKKMAFEPSTSNGGLIAVACNPVEVLVALTVTVCCPPDTPLNCTPDIPARPFDYVTMVL